MSDAQGQHASRLWAQPLTRARADEAARAFLWITVWAVVSCAGCALPRESVPPPPKWSERAANGDDRGVAPTASDTEAATAGRPQREGLHGPEARVRAIPSHAGETALPAATTHELSFNELRDPSSSVDATTSDPPGPQSSGKAPGALRDRDLVQVSAPSETSEPTAAPRPLSGDDTGGPSDDPRPELPPPTANRWPSSEPARSEAASHPIDLPAALRLAEAVNPEIGLARARILEALAVQQGARSLLLPSLNTGGNYHGHTGRLQRSTGEILPVSSQSVYLGGGSFTVAAETMRVPAVNIATPLTDAIFEPLVARQRVDAAKLDARATANRVLLDVVGDYLELQRAKALLSARRRTESEAAEVARITAVYARTGEGRDADAHRAETQWRLRRAEVRAAEGAIGVAAARLAQRLHLDPSLRLNAVGTPLAVVNLVDPDSELSALTASAVRLRPEVGARNAGIGAAESRLKEERARPLLPTLWMGFSGGVFGGGSNLVPPFVGDFRGRTDFDVVCYWTLQNFGLGNLAIQRRRAAEVGQAIGARAAVVARIGEEVAAAKANALAQREQIAIALTELATSTAGFELDLAKIRAGADRPLEVLNNLNLLRKSRESVIDAIVGYNRSQFALFVALGSPPPLEVPSVPAAPAEAAAALAETAPDAPAAAREAGGRDERDASNRAKVTTLAREKNRADSRTVREGLVELERAHTASIQSGREYDRLRTALTEKLSSGAGDAARADAITDLRALDQAHRDVLAAELEYSRILSGLLAELEGQPSVPREARAEESARQ